MKFDRIFMSFEADAPVRRKNGDALKRAFGPYCAVGAGIALLLPESVVASIPAIKQAGEFFGDWIPGIARFAIASSFPETMRLFMLAMWLGFPIATYSIARLWTFPEATLDSGIWTKVKFLGLALLLLLALGYFMAIFVEIPLHNAFEGKGRGGLMVGAMTDSRLGLAFFGCVLFCINAFLVGVPIRFACILARRRNLRT